jgi:hypothetical protein
MSNVARLDDHRDTLAEHFGACPTCHCNDGFVSVGPEHWFVCHRHQVKWYVGANLFSCWREQTDQDRALAVARLATYSTVRSWHP